VTLGDQPRISSDAVARVIEARGTAWAARATYGGVPGHPVLLGAPLFDEIGELGGDTGARALLSDIVVIDVPCDGLGDPYDVDTPADL
jgi:CTP:molybdopterin cytidylyltransferase MocA